MAMSCTSSYFCKYASTVSEGSAFCHGRSRPFLHRRNFSSTAATSTDEEGIEKEDEDLVDPATRRRNVRLYRMLLHQVNALQQKALEQKQQQQQQNSSGSSDNDDGKHLPILLQPPLDLHRMGASRILTNCDATTTAESEQADDNEASVDHTTKLVWKLFYHWERQHVEELIDRDEEEDDIRQLSDDHIHDDENEKNLEVVQLEKLERWAANDENDDGETTTIDNNFIETHNATLWTTPYALKQAIRKAFRHLETSNDQNQKNQLSFTSSSSTSGNSSTNVGPRITSETTHWAIRAYRYLLEQEEMIPLTVSSTTTSPKVRVTAIAKCVGRSFPSSQQQQQQSSRGDLRLMESKYRFVYRIRIEHHRDQNEQSTTASTKAAGDDREEEANSEVAVQLLGRSWTITANVDETEKSLTKLSSSNEDKGDDETDEKLSTQQQKEPQVQKVHAPLTGAVGKHPVLHPTQVFEYMSGCDLVTKSGQMMGKFFFVTVKPGTPTATVGQAAPAAMTAVLQQQQQQQDAIESNDGSEGGGETESSSPYHRPFEVPVHPFPLREDKW